MLKKRSPEESIKKLFAPKGRKARVSVLPPWLARNQAITKPSLKSTGINIPIPLPFNIGTAARPTCAQSGFSRRLRSELQQVRSRGCLQSATPPPWRTGSLLTFLLHRFYQIIFPIVYAEITKNANTFLYKFFSLFRPVWFPLAPPVISLFYNNKACHSSEYYLLIYFRRDI